LEVGEVYLTISQMWVNALPLHLFHIKIKTMKYAYKHHFLAISFISMLFYIGVLIFTPTEYLQSYGGYPLYGMIISLSTFFFSIDIDNQEEITSQNALGWTIVISLILPIVVTVEKLILILKWFKNLER
jgi:hypothetical protein